MTIFHCLCNFFTSRFPCLFVGWFVLSASTTGSGLRQSLNNDASGVHGSDLIVTHVTHFRARGVDQLETQGSASEDSEGGVPGAAVQPLLIVLSDVVT